MPKDRKTPSDLLAWTSCEEMAVNGGTYPAGWGGDNLSGDLPLAQVRSISQGRVGETRSSGVTMIFNFWKSAKFS